MLVEEPKIVPISSNNTHFQGYADRCRKQRERGSLNEKPNAYFPETYTLELIKFHKTHHIGNHTSQSQAIDGQSAAKTPSLALQSAAPSSKPSVDFSPRKKRVRRLH